MAKKIDDAVLDELLKGCERPEDLMADGGLMMEPRRALMQRMLGAELNEHLGYERGDPRAWLADVLARMPNMPVSRLPDLLPWNWDPGPTARREAA